MKCRPWRVALAIGRHAGWMALRDPRAALPALLLPVCCLLAFAGGLSRLGDLPDFDYQAGYNTFAFAFALLQATAFAGSFTALSAARAYELGFASRLALAGRRGTPIFFGYLLAALFRAAAGSALLLAVAIPSGLRTDATSGQALIVAAMLAATTVAAAMWGLGIACRMRSLDASPAIQVPLIGLVFATPAVLPLNQSAPWLQHIEQLNPLTFILETSRNLLAGTGDGHTGLIAAGCLVLATAFWAFRTASSFGDFPSQPSP